MDVVVYSTYYPLFPLFALCSFVLVLIPLPWHLQAWNVGTCAYMLWASVACLLEFIDTVVWNNNTTNLAPVWCDISSKILLGAGIGIPAAGLCISRRLYTISAIKSTVVTTEDKSRAVIIDSCIAFGIPVTVMVLHYVVQPNRFDILEDVGCYAAILNTPLAYFLVFMWPTLLGCISFVFSALTLSAFYKRRLEFSQFLSNHSSFSMSRYIRLMMLATSEMLCTVPISIFSTYIANKGVPIQPWVSWAYTHDGFSYVGQVTAAEWMGDPNYRLSVELTCWLFPACALWFFLLFGFGTEARKHYRTAFLCVAKIFGYRPPSEIEMPVHAQRKWVNKFIPAGSSPIYTPAPSAHVKRQKKLFGSTEAKYPDVDVEKAANHSSPSLYGSCKSQLSRTATSTGSEINECVAIMTDSVPVTICSADSRTIPAHHRPFRPPSIYPAPPRLLHEPRSLRDIRVTVQTHRSTVA